MPAEPRPAGQGGKPPYDHPRRCHATRTCGLRCERWALKGSDYCQFHGGRKANNQKYWTQHVSRFYKRNLSASLESVLAEQLAEKPDDQLALFEELALMRTHAAAFVQVYSKAVEAGNQKAVMDAGELMAMQLQRVAEVCRHAAAIHKDQKDKFSAHDLSFIIEQIIRISYDCFKDDERVNLFALRIRQELDLVAKNKGTTITPDQQVQEMDSLTTGGSQ